MTKRIGITWQLSDVSGWGNFGLNLVYELARKKNLQPLLLLPPDFRNIDPLSERLLDPLIKEQQELAVLSASNPGKVATLDDAVILHHLTSSLELSDVSASFRGKRNIGVVFFESSAFGQGPLERAQKFDQVLAGSSWNGEVLKQNGLKNIQVLLQGVDLARFHPLPDARQLMPDRFIIFSGGKLEYRKGQDIVIAAFRIFYRRHPDALLVTMWHSPWPGVSNTLQSSPYVSNTPELDEHGTQKMVEWASVNGIPERSFIDLGLIPNSHLPNILRNVDVAVFPNRCEGGTNLVAMECMAMGIPCILSGNTGHLDLIESKGSFPLRNQIPVPSSDGSTDDWGESSVDELVEKMEQLYDRIGDGKKRGKIAASWIQNFSWSNQVDKLCRLVDSG